MVDGRKGLPVLVVYDSRLSSEAIWLGFMWDDHRLILWTICISVSFMVSSPLILSKPRIWLQYTLEESLRLLRIAFVRSPVIRLSNSAIEIAWVKNKRPMAVLVSMEFPPRSMMCRAMFLESQWSTVRRASWTLRKRRSGLMEMMESPADKD